MKFDSLSMRARRHAAGVVAMAMGSFGVFFLLHVMNADEGPPEQEDDGKKVAFEVEPPKPPPPKKKPKPKKVERRHTTNAPEAPAPNLGPALRGISFDLPGFQAEDMGRAGDTLLGETNKKMAMTEGAVDVVPQPARRVQPEYPKRARQRGETGYVRMSVFVDETGRVDKVRVVESQPKNTFEEAATNAIKRWEFSPGQYEGQNVGTWVTQTIRFELKKS